MGKIREKDYGMKALTIGTFCLIASLLLWILCYWQLEMVWVGYATGWGYRLAWLPRNWPFGEELWRWRDFWWIIQQIPYFLGIFGAYELTKGYYNQ